MSILANLLFYFLSIIATFEPIESQFLSLHLSRSSNHDQWTGSNPLSFPIFNLPSPQSPNHFFNLLLLQKKIRSTSSHLHCLFFSHRRRDQTSHRRRPLPSLLISVSLHLHCLRRTTNPSHSLLPFLHCELPKTLLLFRSPAPLPLSSLSLIFRQRTHQRSNTSRSWFRIDSNV